ncbi:unnamed protein product, partial [Pylaiella littoralis]
MHGHSLKTTETLASLQCLDATHRVFTDHRCDLPRLPPPSPRAGIKAINNTLRCTEGSVFLANAEAHARPSR